MADHNPNEWKSPYQQDHHRIDMMEERKYHHNEPSHNPYSPTAEMMTPSSVPNHKSSYASNTPIITTPHGTRLPTTVGAINEDNNNRPSPHREDDMEEHPRALHTNYYNNNNNNNRSQNDDDYQQQDQVQPTPTASPSPPLKKSPIRHHLDPYVAPDDDRNPFSEKNLRQDANTVEKIERRRPLWQSTLIAGIDPEVQMMARDYQWDLKTNPVSLQIPVDPSTTLCTNFSLAYSSLFAAFLFILSGGAVGFAGWAVHEKVTWASALMLGLTSCVAAFSIFIAFRNICFHTGHVLSVLGLLLLVGAQITVALYFSLWPNKVINWIYRHDVQDVVKQLADGTTETLPKPRANIATYFQDNLLLLRALTWLAVICQLAALIAMAYSYRQLKKRQYYITREFQV